MRFLHHRPPPTAPPRTTRVACCMTRSYRTRLPFGTAGMNIQVLLSRSSQEAHCMCRLPSMVRAIQEQADSACCPLHCTTRALSASSSIHLHLEWRCRPPLVFANSFTRPSCNHSTPLPMRDAPRADPEHRSCRGGLAATVEGAATVEAGAAGAAEAPPWYSEGEIGSRHSSRHREQR